MVGLRKIEGELHAAPSLGRRIEQLGQPVGHPGRDGGFPVNQVGERLPADAEPSRPSVTDRPRSFRQSSRTMVPGCTGCFMAMWRSPSGNPAKQQIDKRVLTIIPQST